MSIKSVLDENNIKNESLFISSAHKSSKGDNWQEIIISKSQKDSFETTKLSDVFHFLPPGVIYKDETGMGATTLELRAERNSIIVEPIKITASSKAKLVGAFYIGSETKFHPNAKNWKNELESYINDGSIKFKKIVVVADSLDKLLTPFEMKLIDDDRYFLLIDEIDSFQIDSTYRKKMENCLAWYKRFPEKQKALLSATKISFSDPELQNLPYTFFKYDFPSKRTIEILTTDSFNLLGVAYEAICKKQRLFPNDKIFVAYNSVSGAFDLANKLISEGIMTGDQISILCSTASKDAVKSFFKELDNDHLPSKLNFFTSAYFTGFDINESYHLISISGNRSSIHALSDRRLKQIAGRCRTGLLSETIVHDVAIKTDDKPLSAKELVEEAGNQLESLFCIRLHLLKSKLLATINMEITDRFLQILEEKSSRFVKL